MAENDDADTEDFEGEGFDEDVVREGGGGKSRKKLLLVFLLPALLLAGGGGAFLTGKLDPFLYGEAAGGEQVEDTGPKDPPVYFELPEMLVNLNSAGRRSNFLKIVVSLELASPEDVHKLKEAMPRIIDNFQVYLRELRIEDLRGSAGIYRLREELLFRVNAAVNPARVTDVLFKEMLVQ